jgi:hypothetical protein
MRLLAVLGVLLLGVADAPPALSHGGPLDSQGCHFDNLAGGYHCHRGPLAGQYFKSPLGAIEQKSRSGVGAAPGESSAQCCVTCLKSRNEKSCGDSCIPEWKICQQPRGCACDRY